MQSFSEWLLLIFGAVLGCGVGYHVGKTYSTRVQPVETVRTIATPQSKPVSECDHTDEGFHCVRFLSNQSAETIKVDIPNLRFDIGRNQKVMLKDLYVPQLSSKRECERIKAILAKKLVESLLTRAERIHLADVSHDEVGLRAKVQFDGVGLQDVLVGKGLAIAQSPGSQRPD